MANKHSLNDPKTLKAWAMYDWANSVYSLTITTAVFPIYYSSLTQGQVDFFGFSLDANSLYSYALSISFLVLMVLSPLLTGIADYSGKKKQFMQFFCYLGSLSCLGLYFFESSASADVAICLSVLASVGYGGSIVFYNAYLPEIATEDRYDQVSARGFALGYVGSVLLLLVNLGMILGHEALGIGEGFASRLSFLMVGLWWAGFAQITFKRLPASQRKPKEQGWFWQGLRNLREVFQRAKSYPLLLRFLGAFFLYSLGVQTVMYLATIFGEEELQLGAAELIPVVLIIQLVAIAGAYTFSKLSGHWGNTKALSLQVLIWIGICVGAYFIQTAMQYYVVAMAVGLVMGGIQSLSRSTYSKLMPDDAENTASFFSFYDVVEKASIVLGTFYFGLNKQLTGEMRYALFGLGLCFVVSLVMLSRIPSKQVYKD